MVTHIAYGMGKIMTVPVWEMYHNQIDLFNSETHESLYLTESNTKVVVGQFFEKITQQLFPGAVYVDKNNGIQPDFVLWGKRKGDIVLEVKASNKSHIFDRHQVKLYRGIEKSAFPYHNAKAYYVLFFYDNDKPLGLCGSTWNLLTDTLPHSIKCAVVLPLDIVEDIAKKTPQYTYGKWSNGDQEFYARMPRRIGRIMELGRRDLLLDALYLVMGRYLNKEGYSVAKYQSSSSIKIVGRKIPPFSVLVVSKKSLKKVLNVNN